MKQYMWFSVKTFVGVALCAVVLILILSSCTTYQAQALMQNDVTPRPLVTLSATIAPSVTIDYKATAEVAQAQADIAQATADEARRINAMATAEYVRLLNEQIAFTAEVEREEFAIASWTQTAAGTVIPLTATQQVISNTQIADQRTQVASLMTATEHAPTQMVAMLRAQNYQVYGRADYVAGIVGKYSIAIIILGLVAILLRIPVTRHDKDLKPEPEPEPKEKVLGTVVTVAQSHGGPDYGMTRYVVPCTPGQLSEFAENITQGKKTMAINQWEGADTLFTRPVILRFRAWARDNDFAVSTEDNQLAPTNDFMDFLCGWLDKQRLPTEYKFAEKESETSSPSHVLHDSAMSMRVSP
jgi:hypothetical protein